MSIPGQGSSSIPPTFKGYHLDMMSSFVNCLLLHAKVIVHLMLLLKYSSYQKYHHSLVHPSLEHPASSSTFEIRLKHLFLNIYPWHHLSLASSVLLASMIKNVWHKILDHFRYSNLQLNSLLSELFKSSIVFRNLNL